MRLTLLALGSRGDVQPYVALGRGLADAGYRVRLATFESFGDMVRQQGIDFHPVPGDAEALVRAASSQNMLGTRNPLKSMRAIMNSYGRMADDYIAAFSAEALRDSDAILNQLPGGLFGIDLAEKLGVPYLTLSVIPLVPTREFPSPLLAARSFGPILNRQSYFWSGQLLWAFFRSKIAVFRQKLGLGPPSRWFKELDAPVINGFSRQVVPPPVDWGAHVHTTGYWTLAEPDGSPPDDLRAFVEAGSPPVFIGFGSMVAPDAAALTRILLDGVERSGQRAIIARGWAKLGGARLPENSFLLEEYVPYGWLFPRMAAIIHHGGSGTTGLALRSGVPSMVVSFGADQPFWGNRIQAVGAGIAPIPVKQLTTEKLAASIRQLTTDDRLRQGAQIIGQRLAAERGIPTAVEVISQYVERPVS
ncbi:MAG: glycosyltransferase family 1 protein [Anaerolineae bacterium]|nr:glycosyltransferase family 1 protein [Anaerolineae bacterium]